MYYNERRGFGAEAPKPRPRLEDQIRSTKESSSTKPQAPLAKTNNETPNPKTEGAAVSRRMASSTSLYQIGWVHKGTIRRCWVAVRAKMFSGGRGGIKHYIFHLYYSLSVQSSKKKKEEKTTMKNKHYIFENTITYFRYFSSKFKLVRYFSNRGDEVSMCHFKEMVFGF